VWHREYHTDIKKGSDHEAIFRLHDAAFGPGFFRPSASRFSSAAASSLTLASAAAFASALSSAFADAAHMSPRHFSRAFSEAAGVSPAKAVERLRVEAARERVENGAEPIEIIAKAVGFSDPERMRRAFVQIYGIPPQGLRRQARLAHSAPVNS
jgi:methylphosphotriester-DNA--protein-cysteine methyltransferase